MPLRTRIYIDLVSEKQAGTYVLTLYPNNGIEEIVVSVCQ
jgi:hypothetical protein